MSDVSLVLKSFDWIFRDELREFLRNNPVPPAAPAPIAPPVKTEVKDPEEDYKDRDRIQARLRELQNEQERKGKSSKEDPKKKQKRNRS